MLGQAQGQPAGLAPEPVYRRPHAPLWQRQPRTGLGPGGTYRSSSLNPSFPPRAGPTSSIGRSSLPAQRRKFRLPLRRRWGCSCGCLQGWSGWARLPMFATQLADGARNSNSAVDSVRDASVAVAVLVQSQAQCSGRHSATTATVRPQCSHSAATVSALGAVPHWDRVPENRWHGQPCSASARPRPPPTQQNAGPCNSPGCQAVAEERAGL